jgi:hypothetical protein
LRTDIAPVYTLEPSMADDALVPKPLWPGCDQAIQK